MIRRLSVFSLTVAAIMSVASIVCQAQPQSLLTRHVRDGAVNGQAQSVGRLPATQSMRFDIVLALRHAPELDNFLQQLYDPTSPSYRHFVTPQEFTARFGPSQEDYDALIHFAETNGFTVMGGSRDAMDVQLKGTVAAIEKAFHVTMAFYQHPTEKRTFYAPDREPTVDLPFPLSHISGLDNYSIPRPVHHRNLAQQPLVLGSCPGGYYCGSDMRAAYYGSGPLTGAGQVVGLLQYAGYNIADVNTYFNNVHQTLNVPIYGISTDGTNVNCVYPSCDDTEQTLDITQAVSMAPGLSALYQYVGSSDSAILSSMSTHNPLPAQLSASWVWTPADPATDDPYFKKFAAQGQNFFCAAGDWKDFRQSPYAYPPEDAYVTAVGGTDLLTKTAGGAWSSETGWADSGGGISPDGIPIPAWQQLAGVINAQNQGSKTLRNAPDLAGESNFDFYVCANQRGCTSGWGGTSFASPMWAGFMALVNQQAVANGNPTLGFINPTLYPLGVGSNYNNLFHDITSGNNGYPAVTGYDMVTGWGSPIGPALINALAGSGGPVPIVSLSATKLSFAKTPIGQTSPAKSITLTNTGNATLNISSITISGDFIIQNNTCGSQVLAGANCKVTMAFTPTAKGVRKGTLTFNDNANNSPQTVPLTGTGESIALSPNPVNYGTVIVGQSSTMTVTVKNVGPATVSLTSFTITGETTDFSITANTCGGTINAGATCSISVKFAPTVKGKRHGQLNVLNNGGGASSPDKLTGVGG